ncbi:3-hydroxyacyl-ACP dehydratase FabZ family protein [Actinokineospora xionganensis]|uniref:Beta-hydroxyacyl-ACP dehydratase n=1 Tax=Actinokineospora xionganensis TaxID=2684470 RepID=A0ABR7L459_9PSEU|nr:beta-hydroxyacyl-ACP dehydratase [Actinokineospora xionganensis]MBC6447465.1 beta-hydroxyacyl-ACP dehydratase [Actinokineospora xionganensis]
MITAADIRRVLPHRYPMLLVDAVTELVPGERLTARKAVTVNEPWYAGLPDDLRAEQLAYPEVLLLESWAQAAGLLATWAEPNPDVLAGKVMLFGGMSGVEYLRPVLPGDVVEHRVTVQRALSDTVMFEGDSAVDGATVMTVSRMVMAFRPAGVLRPASLDS